MIFPLSLYWGTCSQMSRNNFRKASVQLVAGNMKFLLILPLLVSTTIATIFVRQNSHKHCEEPKLLVNGLINGHSEFLAQKVPKLLKNIRSPTTGIQNVIYPIGGHPIGGSFWYPHYNSHFYPGHQSSGFIYQAPLSHHPHITDLKENLPIIFYREIKPVREPDTPILISIHPFDVNPTIETQAGSMERANYEKTNLNAVVEQNIEDVFTNFPHHTGTVIEEGAVGTINNIGGESSLQNKAYSKVNAPFAKTISNRETIGAYPTTWTSQITYPRVVLGKQRNFQNGEIFRSFLGSGQFNTESSSYTGRSQVRSDQTNEEIKKPSVAHPITDVVDQLGYTSTNLRGNVVVNQNLPLDAGQFPGISQHQTIFGQKKPPSQSWTDYFMRFPLQAGVFQSYPGATEQYPSQSGAFPRYPHLGATGQYSSADEVNEQYIPQSGASQRFPTPGKPNGQFILTGGAKGQYILQDVAFRRYPALSVANEQFFFASGVEEPYFPPGQNPSQTISYERFRPKTGGSASFSSRFKENAPEDASVTKVESIEGIEKEIIEKGLIAIKAPPSAEVEPTKAEVVVEKELIAVEDPSNEKIKDDIKNSKAKHNTPTIIGHPDNEAPLAAVLEGTKTEVIVDKGLIAIEAPSSKEVEGDIIDDEAIQNNSTTTEAPNNEASHVSEVEATKFGVRVEDDLIANGSPSSGEVESDVNDKGSVQNGPTNIGESAEDAESPINEVITDKIEAEIMQPSDDNPVDTDLINDPNETKADTDKEIDGGAEYGAQEVDIEVIHNASISSSSGDGKIIGKEYVSEIIQKPGESEKEVNRAPKISSDADPARNVVQSERELTDDNSKIHTRDTTNVLEEPRTISFTIHLPPKTITTKTVSQVSQYKTKDGSEVNVVPIQRVETVEQKSGSSGIIEPTVTNGPDGVQITFGGSGNIGINQQGEDSTHVFNLGSILGLAQAGADKNIKSTK